MKGPERPGRILWEEPEDRMDAVKGTTVRRFVPPDSSCHEEQVRVEQWEEVQHLSQ